MSNIDNSNNVNSIYNSIYKYFSSNKTMILFLFGIYFIYVVINYLIQLFRYISSPLLISVIILKISVYSLSDNIENDIIEKNILLRQTFIIVMIQLLIYVLNIIETIPFINIMSLFNYISFLLIMLSYLIILPTGIVNILVKKLTSKIYFFNNEILLNEPLSDKIILLIKSYIGHNINIINNYRQIIRDYDNKDVDNKYMNNLMDTFENYKFENAKIIYDCMKIELKKIIIYIMKFIATNTN